MLVFSWTGNWKDKFNPEKTRKGKFFLNDKDSVEVDMMFQEENYALGFNRDLKVQVRENVNEILTKRNKKNPDFPNVKTRSLEFRHILSFDCYRR